MSDVVLHWRSVDVCASNTMGCLEFGSASRMQIRSVPGESVVDMDIDTSRLAIFSYVWARKVAKSCRCERHMYIHDSCWLARDLSISSKNQ